MVEGNGLENRRAGNGTVGSNPTPSARRVAAILKSMAVSLLEKGSNTGSKTKTARRSLLRALLQGAFQLVEIIPPLPPT